MDKIEVVVMIRLEDALRLLAIGGGEISVAIEKLLFCLDQEEANPKGD